MYKQFIGKTFWVTLGAHALVFILAVLAFQTPATSVLIILTMLITAILTWQRLEFGMAIAFAELMANSHGHLISTDLFGFPLSLRMGIFISIMITWLGLVLAQRVHLHWYDKRLWPWYILGMAVLIGFVLGFAYNKPSLAFQDGNAYLYAAYILPIVSIRWTATDQRMLLQVLAASVAWVVLLTFGLLYLYTHLSETILVDTYTFIRDTRTGEITRMEGGFYRVFMQSQFWVYIFSFLIATYFWVRGASKRDWVFPFLAFSGSFSVILISMSRSFWVGTIAAGLTFITIIFLYTKPNVKKLGSAVGFTGLAKLTGFILLAVVVFFPFPQQGEVIGLGSLTSRTGIDDVAVTSRWKLLNPMIDSIKTSPILGHGFGEEIEFQTDDPRVLEQDPSGMQKTFAFEWGWLELVVKMGFLSVAAFAYLFFFSFRSLQPLLTGERAWLGVGLISGLVMLYFTHIFSPYLNHPIGIGYLLFLVPFFKDFEMVGAKISVKDILAKQKTAMAPKATAPLTSQEK